MRTADSSVKQITCKPQRSLHFSGTGLRGALISSLTPLPLDPATRHINASLLFQKTRLTHMTSPQADKTPPTIPAWTTVVRRLGIKLVPSISWQPAASSRMSQLPMPHTKSCRRPWSCCGTCISQPLQSCDSAIEKTGIVRLRMHTHN